VVIVTVGRSLVGFTIIFLRRDTRHDDLLQATSDRLQPEA
jgi:hypothetical protein